MVLVPTHPAPVAGQPQPPLAPLIDTEEVEVEVNEAHERLKRLIAAIEEARRLPVKQRTTDASDPVWTLGRWLGRMLGPFFDFHETIVTGSKLVHNKDNVDLGQIPEEKRERVLSDYKKLSEHAGSLLEELSHLEGMFDAEGALAKIIYFIEDAAGTARRDDIGSLRPAVLSFIPHALPAAYLGSPPLDRDVTTKSCRGFSHVSTGRQLCPRRLRNVFDRDPAQFCIDVREGRISIGSLKYPSFLYPEHGYSSRDKLNGLLRGPFLVAVYRHLFTGPSSALKSTPGPNSLGRPCICVMWRHRKVTPEMIAYAAIMARFALCDKDSWTVQDGNFKLDIFFNCLIGLFRSAANAAWCAETLAWWQNTVWGIATVGGAVPPDEPDLDSDAEME